VVQSAVVGRSIEGNEEVVAFVQLIKGSNIKPEDLADFLRLELAAYKRPSEIILLDALPATSTGKILKNQLAQSLREPVKMTAVN
jgi:acyl-CoA synthetase (AMP-forming)/AMP-acid ligase II